MTWTVAAAGCRGARASRLGWRAGIRSLGEPTGVWSLNANSEHPSTRAYLNVYLPEAARRLGPERVERTAAMLSRLPSMETKIAEARASGWNKYPSLYLGEVASDERLVEVLFAAISDLLAPA